ncbi:hypothetical protein IE81DRAFT_88197 [Ceraceosorus guamensis]|uniref:Uncharacterized protein n=1 Tax=Ceraceosorus guamensis TaxID=1522189 RepID=A0A316W0C4_9BASI|nr:hypothetical protein IE81DRAFT_88197 [Ceraceosorus guamensis]PWN43367.1 hypothetical protein IE81DRAFT_88197 [Ceraceosorus guamensis]
MHRWQSLTSCLLSTTTAIPAPGQHRALAQRSSSSSRAMAGGRGGTEILRSSQPVGRWMIHRQAASGIGHAPPLRGYSLDTTSYQWWSHDLIGNPFLDWTCLCAQKCRKSFLIVIVSHFML